MLLDRAQVEAARLNLGYATITTPILGQARRAPLTDGALDSAGRHAADGDRAGEHRLREIFAVKLRAARDPPRHRLGRAEGARHRQDLGGAALEDGSIFPQTGLLDFLDLSFDEATGVSALRAEFSNPRAILMPQRAIIAVQQASDANAIATAEGVKTRMEELSRGFPADIQWSVPYDTMPFISESIDEVVKTLFAAVILVFLVMFLILQNWRAPLIPTIVVRIALLGACLGLAAFGFAINLLSLFAVEQLLLSLRRQKFDNLAAL